MIVLYILALAVLYPAWKFLSWRAASWEAYFVKVSEDSDELSKNTAANEKPNLLDQARSQMRLVRLAELQDGAAAAHAWWAGWAESVGWMFNKVSAYRNTSFGYLAAKLDTLMVALVALYVNPAAVMELLGRLVTMLGGG